MCLSSGCAGRPESDFGGLVVAQHVLRQAIAFLRVGTGSDESVAQGGQPASDTQEGYRLTQHVLRYYETTKV
jgi:hypothetical protein